MAIKIILYNQLTLKHHTVLSIKEIVKRVVQAAKLPSLLQYLKAKQGD